jgi:aminoglycoside phosphotransferase (APT) family kinase protein
LRIGPRQRLDLEIAASAAASAVVPTPRVLATTDVEGVAAAIVERRPGAPAGHLDGLTIADARQRGAACAVIHDLLAAVAAPDGVPDVSGIDDRIASHRRLLHLDLHPFNVLLDDAGKLSGVIDWANAAAGDPELDRARTLTILTLDPIAMERRKDPVWAAFGDAWIEAGQLRDVTPSAQAWACRYMLKDLAARYSAENLAHIAETLSKLG